MNPPLRQGEHGRHSLTGEWRIWGSVVLCLSLVVVANLLLNEVVSLGVGRATPLRDNLARYLLIWLGRVAIVPIVWWFASWARTDGRPWHQVLGIHVLGTATAVAVHTLIAVPPLVVGVSEGGFRDAGAGWHWIDYLRWQSIDQLKTFIWMDVYAYLGVVGVFYAFHYHSEMLSRAAKAAELESSLTEARLQALRGQLNPHFLFNTLNSISVLAQGGNRRVVSQMIEKLSQLLRRTLDDDYPGVIPLAAELDFVDGYLSLQQMRYSDRLTVDRQIAADALQALVPSMILQPIVENAIEHGVSTCVGAGSVRIQAERHGGMLTLQVSDSGPGFSGGMRDGRGKGIGLSNTEARLVQLYGTSHRILYDSAPGGGATVTIEIPFREAGAMTPSRVA